jgi:hypothetical protein
MFAKKEIKFPARRNSSMQDDLHTRAIEQATPETGRVAIYASWSDSFQLRNLDSIFFTGLNGRACLLVLVSEASIPTAEIVKDTIRNGSPWLLHFAAFLQGDFPILRANLAVPDNPENPFWLEAPLNLTDGDVQEFCKCAMADETIDIIAKHQSMSEGHYFSAFKVNGLSDLLHTELDKVLRRLKSQATREEFYLSYELLQEVYSSGSDGLSPTNTLLLDRGGRMRNKIIYYDPYETAEMREKRMQEEIENEKKEMEEMVKAYAQKLAAIPNLLDKGSGEAACRKIGMEINDLWGFHGMRTVAEHVRDDYDRIKYSSIVRVWDGIGGWMA